MGRTDRERGRDAVARQAWGEAYEHLHTADGAGTLDTEDLERLATAAYLTGRDADRADALERAHRGHLDEGRPADAIRCAFWLGFGLADRGEIARAGGWFARGGRVAEQHPTVPERGYLQLPVALRHLDHDPAEARRLFAEAADLGDRASDRDLASLGRLGVGQARLRLGDVAGGMALLDEVMLAVDGGEVSPVPTGIIYCAVIEACQLVLDLRRAQEWTGALGDWCASQPDLVPYRGQCLVHRAELLQLHGDWQEALAESRRACERFAAAGDDPAVGSAHYRLAELHRLRGDVALAETHYRQAGSRGHPLQPGLALLRLAQGQPELAGASLGRALDEAPSPATRGVLLAAAVEVALATDDLAGARAAADELAALAGDVDAPMLVAISAHVEGAVLRAEGRLNEALVPLRRAASTWRELRVPYETARTSALLGRVCRQLGDADGAAFELDTARATFERLGATADLADLAAPDPSAHPSTGDTSAGGLTDREVEVLRLVAAGHGNRAIADELVISEHTVARHLQNIFVKLDVGSRTAAAAFAYRHDLV